MTRLFYSFSVKENASVKTRYIKRCCKNSCSSSICCKKIC